MNLPTDQRGTRRTLDSDTVPGAVADLGATESGNGTLQDYYLWSQSVIFPGGATAAQRGAAADYDGDGQSNYTEWLAQTSPNSGNSKFAVTSTTTSGQNVEISFPTSTGRTSGDMATSAFDTPCRRYAASPPEFPLMPVVSHSERAIPSYRGSR